MQQPSIFLTAEDVHRLTGRKMYGAQRRALEALGYRLNRDYRLAATGEPLVLKSALDASHPSAQPVRRVEPNWAALNTPLRKLRKQDQTKG